MTSVILNNANGKKVTIRNPDSNMNDIVIDGSAITRYVEIVADLASIDSTAKTVIVRDKDRGGVFNAITSTTANDGTIFNGNGCSWERQYSGSVNVKWFGAKGDGITDDILAIQNAASLFKVVYIPNGTYTISSSISIPSDVHLYGDSGYRTIIQTSGNFPIIQFTGTGFARWNIHDLRLYYTGGYTSTTYPDSSYNNRYALKLSSGTQASPATNWIEQSRISNIEITGAYYGIYNTSGSWDNIFENIITYNTTYGFYWAYGTTLTLTNILINTCKKGFYLYNVYNVTKISCGVDSSSTTSDALNEYISVSSLNIIGWSSESCKLIGNNAIYFSFNNCNGVFLSGSYFMGLSWDGTGGSAYMYFIKVFNNSRSFKIQNYQIPMFSNSHTHANSPAQIAFITADTTTGEPIVENCVFNNLTAVGGSTTSVYFIQQTHIKSFGNVWQGYNFALDFGTIFSSTTPSIGYVKKGVIVYNSSPAASGFIGWVNTADGNPGTWKTFGTISA